MRALLRGVTDKWLARLASKNVPDALHGSLAAPYDWRQYQVGRRLTKYWVIEQAAKQRGFTLKRMGSAVCRLSDANDTLYFHDLVSEWTSAAASFVASDKFATKKLLQDAGVPAPAGEIFKPTARQAALHYFQQLQKQGATAVIKPVDGIHGNHVYTNLSTDVQFLDAWDNAALSAKRLLIECYVAGDDYRLFVLDGKLIAATSRQFPFVVGDGESSLHILAQKREAVRQANPHLQQKRSVLENPKVDHYLARQGLSWSSVPALGQHVDLLDTVNVTSGGDYVDVSEHVHAGFFALAEKVAKAFPPCLHFGLDLLAEDISKDPARQEWAIIEINHNASIAHHHFPSQGLGRDVAGAYLDAVLKRRVAEPRLPACGGVAKAWTAPAQGARFTTGYAIHRQLLAREAFSRNIAVNKIYKRIWSARSGEKLTYFAYNMPDQTSHAARKLSNFKATTKSFLKDIGVRSPQGSTFKASEKSKALEFADSLSGAFVYKPMSGSGGKGVHIGLQSRADLVPILQASKAKEFLIEEHIEGNDHRLLVLNGTFIAAAERKPAYVVGDGVHNVEQLIEQKNMARARNPYVGKSPIVINSSVLALLAEQGIKLADVPAKGREVKLQKIANVGAGGESTDCTDIVHPGFIAIAEKIWRHFPRTNMVGIDLLTSDISKSPEQQPWAVIEVNTNPDIAMHHFPWVGQARDVAGLLVDCLFPQSKAGGALYSSKSYCLSGEVQGVGMRNFIRKECVLHAAYGQVYNCRNGDVEALVHATPAAHKALEMRFKQRPKAANVAGLKVSSIPNIDANSFVVSRDR